MNEWDIMVRAIRDHGKHMAFGAISGVIIAICITLLARPVYESRMTVAPTARTGMPSLGSLLPQTISDTPVLQYFAARIDAADTSDFAVFETLVNSPRLAQKLIDNNNTAHINLPQNTAPRMAKWLNKHVAIRPVGTSPFRKITLRHPDPDMALRLLGVIFQETDMMIRQDKRQETARRITYLTEQLDNTRHPDHQDAIIALLKEQEQTAMMVSIDNHFAARPIDPPTLSLTPVFPNAYILIPAFLCGGVMIGFMLGGFLRACKRPAD